MLYLGPEPYTASLPLSWTLIAPFKIGMKCSLELHPGAARPLLLSLLLKKILLDSGVGSVPSWRANPHTRDADKLYDMLVEYDTAHDELSSETVLSSRFR